MFTTAQYSSGEQHSKISIWKPSSRQRFLFQILYNFDATPDEFEGCTTIVLFCPYYFVSSSSVRQFWGDIDLIDSKSFFKFPDQALLYRVVVVSSNFEEYGFQNILLVYGFSCKVSSLIHENVSLRSILWSFELHSSGNAGTSHCFRCLNFLSLTETIELFSPEQIWQHNQTLSRERVCVLIQVFNREETSQIYLSAFWLSKIRVISCVSVICYGFTTKIGMKNVLKIQQLVFIRTETSKTLHEGCI